MPAKRQQDEELPYPRERPAPESNSSNSYSSAVRKKQSSSQRTGQACDRCKIRKIRCDARPGGCSPCMQNNAECKTTDRITGRATSRGYTETVEQQNDTLKYAISELQQQLRELGVEPKPTSSYLQAVQSAQVNWSARSNSDANEWEASEQSKARPEQQEYNGTSASSASKSHEPNMFAIPTIRRRSRSDNSSGAATALSSLSTVRGTSLSVFGMKIDLTEYLPPEDISTPTSYSTFLALAFNRTPRRESPLPDTYEEFEEHSKWYFKAINSWMPLLHPPSFMELIKRYYQEQDFVPSSAEIVTMHMVLAMWKYQIGTRNLDHGLQAQSHAHYHHCLAYLVDIWTGGTLQDMQAFALIAWHMRFFPSPGPAWVVSNWGCAVAIENGLHRSASASDDNKTKMSALDIELRKRIFWAFQFMNVTVGGKLGRPMRLRREDFDIEIPEQMNDNLPGEPPGCSFLCAIEMFKMSELFLEIYTRVYTVVPSANYEDVVKSIEAKTQRWHDERPSIFSMDASPSDHQNRVFGLWLQGWERELQILLHHPAQCRSPSPEFMARNLKICGQASSEFINFIGQLKKYKSLDTTWTSATNYISAAFTLLFVTWQRRDEITSADLKILHADMNLVMEILFDAGYLIGSGTRLLDATRPIIDSCLLKITNHINQKTASEAVAHVGIGQTSSQPASQAPPPKADNYSDATSYGNSYHNSDTSVNGQIHNPGSEYATNRDASVPQPQASYSAITQNTYPQAAAPAIATYPYSSNAFESQAYNVGDGGMSNPSQVPTHIPQQHDPYGFSNNTYQAQMGGPLAWREWTEAMKVNHLEPQEYLPASALMQLGGRDLSQTESGHNHPALPELVDPIGQTHLGVSNMATVASHTWPFALFDPMQSRNHQ